MPASEPATGRRVLFVVNSLARGGAETQLLGVARTARAAGDEVVVATLIGGNDFAAQAERDGLVLWTPGSPDASWSVRRVLGLLLAVRRWRPDVVVSFLFQATLVARLACLLARPRRAVASMRNERLETALRARVYRATAALDDVVVVNSESARVTLQASRTVPRDPERVAVVYNGIDAEAVRARATADPEATRRALGVTGEEVLLLGVGRLSAQKDWRTLVDAMAATTAPSRCVVAGEGGQRAELEEYARQRGVADRLTFLGLRHDVPDLLAAADALVLSSLHEGTPNVVLEALAMGTPVVASDVGACRELVSGTAGEVVPPGDAAALAAALDRRATPRRLDGGSAGSDIAHFSWEVVGRQWLDLLGTEDVSDAGRGARAGRPRGRRRPPG